VDNVPKSLRQLRLPVTKDAAEGITDISDAEQVGISALEFSVGAVISLSHSSVHALARVGAHVVHADDVKSSMQFAKHSSAGCDDITSFVHKRHVSDTAA